MILRIVIQLLLLSASAFFSGSEVALFSLSRMDLDRLRREGHPQAANLFGLLEQPRRLIISILCGNELVNVAAAANMATILLALFDETRAGVLNLLVMVPLLLLFGEVTPKTVAISDPVRLATRVTAAPMAVWVRLVTPLRRVVRLLAESLTTRIVGEEASRENILVADEIRLIAKELEERGELRLEERALVDSFLEAGATEVVEIMRPRTRMAFVNASATVPEALARFRSVREGRLPVYRGQRDNLVGMLRAEDFMQLVLDGTDLETVALEDLIRPPVVVPPTKKLDEVLDYFRAHDVSAAVVMSEFGGVEGLVTLRMLLDAMFRPVTGAHLDPERFAGPDPGTFDVPGDMKLTDFNLLTGFNVDDPRMTTVGGLVYRHLDRVPDVDDRVSIEGIGFTVLEMDELRIARVRAGRGVEVDREEDDA
ncbi:MAG: hemolysin family protein [Pseudomonadales bacterium]|nr:hemolysin family protein [Pseudomonadales bacterium]